MIIDCKTNIEQKIIMSYVRSELPKLPDDIFIEPMLKLGFSAHFDSGICAGFSRHWLIDNICDNEKRHQQR